MDLRRDIQSLTDFKKKTPEFLQQLKETGEPVVLTTNKPFSEWPDVFPHAACVVTLVDRLIHRCEVLHIEGQSYRAKGRQQRRR